MNSGPYACVQCTSVVSAVCARGRCLACHNERCNVGLGYDGHKAPKEPRATGTIDIMPLEERRRTMILAHLNRAREQVLSGDISDLIILRHGDGHFSFNGAWGNDVELIGILTIMQRSVMDHANDDD